MEFNELLNAYMEKFGCSARELAETCGLSEAALSRYRKGERIPGPEQKMRIVEGLAAFVQGREDEAEREQEIRADFAPFEEMQPIDGEQFAVRFNTLISSLDIRVSELARAMNFDASYISRIRLGQRRPSEPEHFAENVCRFVIRKKKSAEDRAAIASLLGCAEEEIASDSVCLSALCSWLCSKDAGTQEIMEDFLKKLDDFDLNRYIRAIRFDELKVPHVPFSLPASRNYYGVQAMKQGELDFFKTTVLSKSMEPVFMCSDMPMADMAEDLDFGKKWMFAIAMTLKKGLHLNMIHNIDRPFEEMMLGLESWIPLYMTGQVSPYYLKGKHNSVYCHFNYVSGQAALTGECIQGFHDEGKYYLTNNREEVAYYRKKAARLLEKASPLMEIYRQDGENAYEAFRNNDAGTVGARHNILPSLPVYTMPQETLAHIMERSDVPAADRARLTAFVQRQRELQKVILQNGTVLDEIPVLTPQEFEKQPMAVSLVDAFYERELYYTYEEYAQHLQATQEYAGLHPGYSLQKDTVRVFCNIRIQLHEGKWAMVSKANAPAIHFVIRHSKMLHALENFKVPVVEAENEAEKSKA